MGRSLSGAFGAGAVSQGVFNLKAGAAILQNDLVQLGPDGKAFPVKVTDYAAVSNLTYGTQQTSAATGQIVAATQIIAGQTTAYYRQAVLQGTNGSIYTFTANAASNQGLLLNRYSASGGLISQTIVDGTTATYFAQQSFFLSNGNICVVAGGGPAGGKIYFAIYDTNLVQIVGLTALTEDVPALYFSAIALSSGGFAIVYQQTTNPLLSRLVTYSNAGAAVLAPTTVWTRTGSSAAQQHKMAQLSNGNLAIAITSANTVSSMGLYHGIVTTGGASVLAFTNIDPSSAASVAPDISVISGYYAISRHNGTAQLAFVFDNSGTLQGAGFSGVNGNGADSNKSRLINDGTAFWLIWPRSSDGKQVITKIPTSGVGYSTTIITTSSNVNYNLTFDAFAENGLIVGISQISGSQPVMWVVNTITQALVSPLGTQLTSGGGTPDGYIRVIPGGDFSFITLFGYSTTASTQLCVGKYANTAVMGVAQGAAEAGILVPTATPSGGYSCNQLAGSPTKTFDHSTANIYGNKGAMLTYGVTLKGM